MTLVAAAVCPHPPLLVPEVAGTGAEAEPVDVLAPALAAVGRLLAAKPDTVVLIGDAPRTGPYPPSSAGSLAGFGVDLDVPLSGHSVPPADRSTALRGHGRAVNLSADPSVERSTHGPGELEPLPLSLTIGAWLLRQAGWPGPRQALGVAAGVSPAQAARLGAEAVRATGAAQGRVGLLVMGDGSARRTLKAPGYFDDRAAGHDQAVADALARVDAQALLDLDPGLSTRLLAAGRAPWQVLAGALLADETDDTDAEVWHGDVLYADAPYGVGYLVAVWERGRR